MILVTVGTVAGFDDLVRRMDVLAAGKLAGCQIIAQIANSKYTPRHMRYFRFWRRLNTLFAGADLIVGHGGSGTTIEALKAGKRFVGVGNPDKADDHQNELLRELARRGLLIHCTDLQRLDEAIDQAWRSNPAAIDTTAFGRKIAADMAEQLANRRPGRLRWRRSRAVRSDALGPQPTGSVT